MSIEFQYLKVPYGENVLALLGSEWIQEYGLEKNTKEDKEEHFHNLMEIAVCRMGSGDVYIDHERFEYQKDDVIVIPRNFSHAVNSLLISVDYTRRIQSNKRYLFRTFT